MENCLVKQYRTPAINSNLEYFDALQFSVDWTKYDDVNHGVVIYNATGGIIMGGIGVKFKILSNGYIYDYINPDFSNPRTEWTMDGTAVTRIIKPVDETKPTEFLMVGLQKITRIRFNYQGGVYLRSPKTLALCRNLTKYYDTNILIVFKPYPEQAPYDSTYIADLAVNKEDITAIRYINDNEIEPRLITSTSTWKDYVNITDLLYYAFITHGNISELSGLTKITNLNLRFADIIGDIASLGTMTSITTINLNGSGISGSIEDFVAAQRQNGRTTASRISIRCAGSYHSVTYNGTVIQWNPKYLSWDAQGNITVEDS